MVADKVVTTRHLVDAVGARAAASKCRWWTKIINFLK